MHEFWYTVVLLLRVLHLQRAAEDPQQVELLVDSVILTASDEGGPEVPPTGLTNGRQAGGPQVVVEVLHLVGRLLCKESETYLDVEISLCWIHRGQFNTREDQNKCKKTIYGLFLPVNYITHNASQLVTAQSVDPVVLFVSAGI